jgi:integrase
LTEKLTDAIARKALPPSSGQCFLWDGEVKGFALRVTARGAKSFVLDYRVDGRQRRITLGNYPDWTVQAARAAAKTMKWDVDLGQDPMGERHALRDAPTVQDLWERYQSEKLPTKAARTQTDERSMWHKIILPRLGKHRIADVTYNDIDELHRDVTRIRKTPVRANRMVEVLRGAFNFAIRWHWRQDNPARGVQRNPEEKRERYLSKSELMALARALNEHPEVTSANAIKLLLLTGARRGEVLGARWDMFDLEEGIWVKPSAHTKQRRTHRVPLSSPALELLKSMHFDAKNPFVFCGAEGKPLVDIKRTWVSVCKTAGFVDLTEKRTRSGKPVFDEAGTPILIEQPNLRIHDLRHAFASVLVSAGASLPLIGQLLGHTQAQTTLRYAHLFDRPMRDAAEAVGTFVQPQISSGTCNEPIGNASSTHLVVPTEEQFHDRQTGR